MGDPAAGGRKKDQGLPGLERLPPKVRQIGVDHQLDEVFLLRLRLPAYFALGLRRIADQQLHLGRAVIARVYFRVLLRHLLH